MGGHNPTLLITDQDPAMKVVIENVFTSSIHIFCMWHIMKKVSEKVGVSYHRLKIEMTVFLQTNLL